MLSADFIHEFEDCAFIRNAYAWITFKAGICFDLNGEWDARLFGVMTSNGSYRTVTQYDEPQLWYLLAAYVNKGEGRETIEDQIRADERSPRRYLEAAE